MPGARRLRVSEEDAEAERPLKCYSMKMEKTDDVIQAMGWAGAVAVLAAYALTSMEIVGPVDALPIALNVAGAAGIALASWKRRAFQSVLVNVAWLFIGLATAVKLLA